MAVGPALYSLEAGTSFLEGDMLTSDSVQARKQAPEERQEAQDKAVLEQSEMLTMESIQAQEQAPGEQQEVQEEAVREQSESTGEQPIRLQPWEQCPYSGCTHHNRPDYQCYKCSVAYHRDCIMKKLARTSRNSSYCETLEPITDSRHPTSRLTPIYAFLCQMCTKEKHANDAFCVACQQETRPMIELPDVAPEVADKLSSLLRCTSCWLSYHVGCLTIDYHNRFRDHPPKYLAHLSELGSPSLFLRTFNCTNCLLYPLASWKLSNIFTYRDPSPSETKPLKPQREYLVKFEETSFRDVAWVSERWLSQNFANRLSSFRRAVKDAMEQWEAGAKSHGIPPPYPAPVEAIILPEWSQVDKILSVLFTDAEDDDIDDSEDNVVGLDAISGSDGTSSEDSDGVAIRGGYEEYDDDYSNSQSKKRKQHRRLSKYAMARAKKARRSSSLPTSEAEWQTNGESFSLVKRRRPGLRQGMLRAESSFSADVTSTTCIDPSRVDQVLVKWRLRGYEDCTWEHFPAPSESDYGDFVQALRVWEKWKSLSSIDWWEERERKSKAGLIKPIPAREDVIIRAQTAPHDHAADDGTCLSESSVVLVDDLDVGKEPGPSGASTVLGTGQVTKTLISDQPLCIHGGKLKEYQIEGVNWLYTNFILSQSCILADQPGLGKTIQIITFLSVLYHDHSIYPHLIVVPASTVSNWEREFQKWAPDLRVVAYSGATEAQREYIRDYELLCDPNDMSKGLKAHVVVTSYEWVSRDPELFIEGLGKAKARDVKARPRYHTLIVDEGHRLKNDDTNLYRILKDDFEARGLVGLTILLTGTPMQNNLRELFNVLSFIDGGKFDAEELERTYGVDGSSLTSESVKQLHDTIRPFFLRREKKDVLKTDIRPRIETILPIAMTTLQKQIYRAILTKNYKLLTDSTQRRKKGMMNVLMELRKVCNHPYLVDGVEPDRDAFVALKDRHELLVKAGGKSNILRMLLRVLYQRHHRPLIFSTSVATLKILEDMIRLEGYIYTVIDGNTPLHQRQERIDYFSAPGSPAFAFLLSTRAAGQGINLASADCVILYDPDFNPHVDEQAICRAHRIGQENGVMVWRFVCRNSVEEKVVERGRSKMALDHVVMRRMNGDTHSGLASTTISTTGSENYDYAASNPSEDNDEVENVESVLQTGARALFEEDVETPASNHADDASAAKSTVSRAMGKMDYKSWQPSEGDEKSMSLEEVERMVTKMESDARDAVEEMERAREQEKQEKEQRAKKRELELATVWKDERPSMPEPTDHACEGGADVADTGDTTEKLQEENSSDFWSALLKARAEASEETEELGRGMRRRGKEVAPRSYNETALARLGDGSPDKDVALGEEGNMKKKKKKTKKKEILAGDTVDVGGQDAVPFQGTVPLPDWAGSRSSVQMHATNAVAEIHPQPGRSAAWSETFTTTENGGLKRGTSPTTVLGAEAKRSKFDVVDVMANESPQPNLTTAANIANTAGHNHNANGIFEGGRLPRPQRQPNAGAGIQRRIRCATCGAQNSVSWRTDGRRAFCDACGLRLGLPLFGIYKRQGGGASRAKTQQLAIRPANAADGVATVNMSNNVLSASTGMQMPPTVQPGAPAVVGPESGMRETSSVQQHFAQPQHRCYSCGQSQSDTWHMTHMGRLCDACFQRSIRRSNFADMEVQAKRMVEQADMLASRRRMIGNNEQTGSAMTPSAGMTQQHQFQALANSGANMNVQSFSFGGKTMFLSRQRTPIEYISVLNVGLPAADRQRSAAAVQHIGATHSAVYSQGGLQQIHGQALPMPPASEAPSIEDLPVDAGEISTQANPLLDFYLPPPRRRLIRLLQYGPRTRATVVADDPPGINGCWLCVNKYDIKGGHIAIQCPGLQNLNLLLARHQHTFQHPKEETHVPEPEWDRRRVFITGVLVTLGVQVVEVKDSGVIGILREGVPIRVDFETVWLNTPESVAKTQQMQSGTFSNRGTGRVASIPPGVTTSQGSNAVVHSHPGYPANVRRQSHPTPQPEPQLQQQQEYVTSQPQQQQLQQQPMLTTSQPQHFQLWQQQQLSLHLHQQRQEQYRQAQTVQGQENADRSQFQRQQQQPQQQTTQTQEEEHQRLFAVHEDRRRKLQQQQLQQQQQQQQQRLLQQQTQTHHHIESIERAGFSTGSAQVSHHLTPHPISTAAVAGIDQNSSPLVKATSATSANGGVNNHDGSQQFAQQSPLMPRHLTTVPSVPQQPASQHHIENAFLATPELTSVTTSPVAVTPQEFPTDPISLNLQPLGHDDCGVYRNSESSQPTLTKSLPVDLSTAQTDESLGISIVAIEDHNHDNSGVSGA
ncbi:hypothetical protein HDU85_003619 [Gaertneriomyces sp. JEL0708]|nr:hypothetical protein HDU85_003619 [Gaertneriomyces sp. JEL0708]